MSSAHEQIKADMQQVLQRRACPHLWWDPQTMGSRLCTPCCQLYSCRRDGPYAEVATNTIEVNANEDERAKEEHFGAE